MSENEINSFRKFDPFIFFFATLFQLVFEKKLQKALYVAESSSYLTPFSQF